MCAQFAFVLVPFACLCGFRLVNSKVGPDVFPWFQLHGIRGVFICSVHRGSSHVKTDECKDHHLYLAWLHWARTPTRHLSIAFCITCSHLLVLVSGTQYAFKSLLLLPSLVNHTLYIGGNVFLIIFVLSLCPLLLNSLFQLGLWNGLAAVNKADFLSSIATHSSLNLMTWIKP